MIRVPSAGRTAARPSRGTPHRVATSGRSASGTSQASGLPVVAVERGGPACLIEHGETGLLAPPDLSALADAVVAVTGTPLLSEHIGRGGLAAVRDRSWEAALDRLATAYRIALAGRTDHRLERGVA